MTQWSNFKPQSAYITIHYMNHVLKIYVAIFFGLVGRESKIFFEFEESQSIILMAGTLHLVRKRHAIGS